MELNVVLERLPRHLLNLVIDQPYNAYTPQDHAVWRYVMRRNVDYLQHVAHASYLEGLSRTGVSIDSIPHMYGMNRILKEIGWAAVAVDGFIPPAAFMEFQAYNVLVIAADIRPVDQIEYTPAPDIIHEAAGHAPIIANEEYAAYLRYFGEIGSKAFSSAKDHELYEAIRHLSILKADPYSSRSDIINAENKLLFLEENMGNPSEMALIRNLHWWTVEYGLIGDISHPKIYGAGLLSSIGESFKALQDNVKKLPYTIDAKDYNFDITTMQPQLFVTPDFQSLTSILDEFASQMALKTGGITGINKAIASGNLATCTFSSGLQVSGIFIDVIAVDFNPVYLKTTGPTQLSYNFKELTGHGKIYHSSGFGSPVGRLKNSYTPLRFLTDNQLENLNILFEKESVLEFESGITVKGILKNILREEGKIILMTFENCMVRINGQTLFEPTWGAYDMAVGDEIVSAFNGVADPDAYGMKYPVPREKTHKIIHSSKSKILHEMYEKIRSIRENSMNITGRITTTHNDLVSILRPTWEKITSCYPDEWLLPLEMFELLRQVKTGQDLSGSIGNYLEAMASVKPELKSIIENGMRLSA